MSPASGRQALVWLTKIAVSAGLLVVLFLRVDFAELWAHAREAEAVWLAGALAVYLLIVVMSAWRWGMLLDAVLVPVRKARVLVSFLVAIFFNNFLPSNIGGDVIRIADTARPAGSKTIATLIVLADRGVGLMGLLAVAALGATLAAGLPGTGVVGPSLLWALLAGGLGVAIALIWHQSLFLRLLRPIQRVHPEWIGERLLQLDGLLGRLRLSPFALAACLANAVAMQLLLVAFYLSIARALSIPIGYWQLAVVVPMTFLVQMLPMSLNGFGVREASFAYYFTRLGLSIEQALVVSFMGAAIMILVSLSGAAAYVSRNRSARAEPVAHRPPAY